ncbi:MAG: hypothetical protein CMM49_04530 [Rhodospirillaceae bacterium]|nr:hypothetical protein [Rhodospirillaceae bacterium]|tara:strand:+ start:1284 stop:1892 length:609 start_codon:yes stop_codon:yes gene_type:complete
MKVNNHLIIFSKIPRYAIVKKRLAKEIGNIEALRFYDSLLKKNIRNLGGDTRWNCWLALSDMRAKFRRDKSWRCKFFFQGHGSLGSKMEKCFKTVPDGNTILVGGDIPNLAKVNISNAFNKLRFYDLVLGPSFDGGFWLIGIRGNMILRRKNITNLFESVRWSSEHALSDTIKNITNRKLCLLNYKNDIDTYADLKMSKYLT